MDNKKLYIGTNLKMYKGVGDTVDYLRELGGLLSDVHDPELAVFVIPSFTALYPSSLETSKNQIMLGAQNMHWEDSGQFTGEISPLMLKEVGVEIIEIGHSERREHFHETDFTVNKRVLAALRHNLKPLICIGETALDKELNVTDERLRIQTKIALTGVSEDRVADIMMAYEPVWAIGEHGVPASEEYANQKHEVIREVLVQMFPTKGGSIPVLYGGSVNPENAPP